MKVLSELVRYVKDFLGPAEPFIPWIYTRPENNVIREASEFLTDIYALTPKNSVPTQAEREEDPSSSNAPLQR